MFTTSAPAIDKPQGYGGYTLPNTTAWQQGLVVHNMFFDWSSYNQILENIKNRNINTYTLYYDAPCNASTHSIFQGQPIVRLKGVMSSSKLDNSIFSGSMADNGARKCIGSLNGLGFFDLNGTLDPLFNNPNTSEDTFKRHLRSQLEFIGLSQTDYIFAEGGLRDFTKNLSFPAQLGGTETCWNSGNKPIRPFKKIVWDVPERRKLGTYPPRLNNFLGGRSPDSVMIVFKEYDVNEEFNINNIFKAHLLKFPKCVDFNFKQAKNYLPASMDSYEVDFTLEGFHTCLFSFVYSILSIYDASISETYIENLFDNWKGPIKSEDVGKILKTAQKTIVQSVNGSEVNEATKIKIDRLLKVSLIAMEATFFADQTDIYRSGKSKDIHTYDIKRFGGGSAKSMLSIWNNIQKELNDRIVGTSLSAAEPGYAFEMLLGQSRTCT